MSSMHFAVNPRCNPCLCMWYVFAFSHQGYIWTPEYEASVHYHFENSIKEVTPYILESCSEVDLNVLVSDVDSPNHESI